MDHMSVQRYIYFSYPISTTRKLDHFEVSKRNGLPTDKKFIEALRKVYFSERSSWTYLKNLHGFSAIQLKKVSTQLRDVMCIILLTLTV